MTSSLFNEIKQYLEQCVKRFSILPAYYTEGLTFQQLHQFLYYKSSPHASDRIWWDGYDPTRSFDPVLAENTHWAGWFWAQEAPVCRDTIWAIGARTKPSQRRTVLGESGSGKSWLLHAEGLLTALQQLERLQQGEQALSTLTLPIFCPLPDLAQELAQEIGNGPALTAALTRMIEHNNILSTHTLDWMQARFLTHQTLFLLDDLHRVAPEQHDLLMAAL